MIVASAQTIPNDTNIEANIRRHCHLIELAGRENAELVLFPEMSITGYLRESAAELAFGLRDERLEVFRRLARQHSITIIVGAPLKEAGQLYIASLIFSPGQEATFYAKHFLHEGEERYFSASSNHYPILQLGDATVTSAICYDIARPEHAAKAAANKTSLYAASIFYTPAGIANGHECLGNYAKQYGMNILMSNYAGFSWQLKAAGRSAFWNKKGDLIGELDNSSEGLLIMENYTNSRTIYTS